MPLSTLTPRISLRNARAWAPRSPSRWMMALIAFLAALALRLSLHDMLGARVPLVTFTLATIVIHFFFGLGPAVLLALVSLPVADFFFVPPYLDIDLPDADDLFLWVYYVLSTALLMVLIQYLRRAQYQAVLFAEIAESRQLMLLDAEADRAALEAEFEKRGY